MRPILLALAIITVSPAWAETDPAEIELSPIMERIMEFGIDGAAQQLAKSFALYSVDEETVDLSDMDHVLDRNLAERRAQKVYNYLSADLNWDGRVTRAELMRLFNKPGDEGFVEGWLKDGDIDGDGVITLDEMRKDALRDHPHTSRPVGGYMREMIGWDLDGDGVLHFDEVIRVIIAHQK